MFFTTGGAQHLHSMSDGVTLDLRHLHSFHIPLTFGEAILMYIQDCLMDIEANRSRLGLLEGDIDYYMYLLHVSGQQSPFRLESHHESRLVDCVVLTKCYSLRGTKAPRAVEPSVLPRKEIIDAKTQPYDTFVFQPPTRPACHLINVRQPPPTSRYVSTPRYQLQQDVIRTIFYIPTALRQT